MNVRKLGPVILVVLIFAAGTLLLWGRLGFNDSVGAEMGVPLDEPVKASNVINADAKVVPVRSSALSVHAAGIVAEVLVQEGQYVDAGQVLLRLDGARQRAALAQAEAQVQRAESFLEQLKKGARPQEIEAAQAAVDAAHAQLSKARVSAPALDILLAETEVRRAEAQLDLILSGERPENIAAAEADVAAAHAALEMARVALDETELRAPYSGVIAALYPNVGEFVAPGNPVVWLADTSAWLIETGDLTEINVVRIEEGSPVSIKIDAIPDLDLTGKVVRINPLGENRFGDITYKVVIQPDRYDERFRWNMTASVAIAGRGD